MTKFYDRARNAIGLMTWAELLENGDYRLVALDDVDGIWISTIWVGFDHNMGIHREPLIFETMVYGAGAGSIEPRRYATEDEALDGHRHAVDWVANGGHRHSSDLSWL
jgi:hypothetical protein